MKNKKAAIYESFQGLIIFIVLLIAVLMFSRSCFQEEQINKESQLKKIQTEFNKITLTDGLKEVIPMEIEEESAIIGYSKDDDAIRLNFEINTKYIKGKIPENINDEEFKEKLELNEIKGVIKEKPNDCQITESCLCYCQDLNLETRDESEYNWQDAYITCESETCLVLSEQNIKNKIMLKEFFEETDKRYRELKNTDGTIYEIQPDPQLETIYWTGGFIILRTTKNIGTNCFEKDCFEVYNNPPKEDVAILQGFILQPTIAGYRRNYASKLFDVEIENKQGEITPKLK